MEISLPIEELRKRSLFVAVPMYGGQCAGMFTRSVNDLSALAVRHGIVVKFYYLFNESLVTRARNYCADEFLRSDCTHMMFIDSDIGFDANDVLTMLALMSDDSQYDVLGAPYPKKTISWEKIKMAVDKGFADEDPNKLANYVGDYVFNPANGTNQILLSEPAEVMELGTGFMMIKRSALEKFQKEYPELMYRPDHVRTAAFDGSREITAFFDALIDNKHSNIIREVEGYLETNKNASHEDVLEFIKNTKLSYSGTEYSNRYLSEDYMFCQWCRKIGLKIWLCPWMKLSHVGSYIFGGSLMDLAQVGASATVDVSQLKSKL